MFNDETLCHCVQGEDAVIADPNDGILSLRLDLEKCKDDKQRLVLQYYKIPTV
jgi:hypothetical protein